ncbi:FAD/NAD(P)-binding domain-containing protein [Suillus hirtellus]|nr:FAD/NAD(P)-binding domain-containing protein [Suillus hirtellus]
MSHPIISEFDVIFAGGDSTACVVAGCLAALDPLLMILILKGGQHTLNQPVHVQPCKFTRHLAPTSTTMTFNIGNPSPRLNGRAPIVPCAHCIGGGSTMCYTCGPASDFDDWGAKGWESKDLIPLMKKLETYQVQPNCPTHRYSGPIKVSSGGCKLDIFEEFIHSTHEIHFSHGQNEYIGVTGRCSDAAHHYVYNQAHNANLQIWVGKCMKCMIFQDKCAVGVEFTSNPVSCPDMDQSPSIVKASKLVVISAGAFGLPAILERSGIGAEAFLKWCNIKQLVDLPGIGENYRDHNLIFTPYFAAKGTVTMDPLFLGEESDVVVQKNLAQWKIDGKLLVAQNDAKIKWCPDDDELKAMEFFQDCPEKPVALFSLCAGASGFSCILPHHSYMAANYFTLYPVSAGSVHIKLDENGQEGIDFNAGFLDDPSDIVPLIFGYKKSCEIIQCMSSYRGEVPMGHPHFPQGSAAVCRETTGPVDLNAPDITYTAEDDDLRTCAMKPRADKGVIDTWLNVYSVTNLKVADMSIALMNVGMNTYWTALLIGEMAAMIIADELGI